MVNDLIERQAAIDLAHELIVPNEYKYGLYNQAINNYCVEIMNLPSAEPEQNAYEQGRITGRVEMRTEILSALKNMVGSEVWNNI